MSAKPTIHVYFKENGLLRAGKFLSLRNRRLYVQKFKAWDWVNQSVILDTHQFVGDVVEFVREEHETYTKCGVSDCTLCKPMWVKEVYCQDHQQMNLDMDLLIQSAISYKSTLQQSAYNMRVNMQLNAISLNTTYIQAGSKTLSVNHMSYEEIKKALGVDDQGNPVSP
jgi:hypothetical protein